MRMVTHVKFVGRRYQCSRIRILRFFPDFKKHDFLRFFEITYQKVVKVSSKSLVLNPSK